MPTSYRYQRTKLELIECVNELKTSRSLTDIDLSGYEKDSLHIIYALCKEYIAAYDDINAVLDLCILNQPDTIA